MKRTVGIVAAVLALVGAITAQAAYVDAISINLANGDGSVSGPQVGANGSVGNWINMGVLGGNSANSRASIDGSGFNSTSFDSSLTANGVSLAGTPFALQFYDGGWGVNSAWNDGGQPANSLSRSGISNGDMPSGWGPSGLGIEVQNVPLSFQTSTYDIWALGGASFNSGSGLTWTKLNATPLSVATPASYTFNSLGWRSVGAVQVLQIGAEAAVPEPSTLMLIGLGGLSLIGIARRFRK